ncbi:class III lanthionine synthetase LanKC [Alkalihalophilus marmarensis]|uniref:Protein kinase domain-containing protein n=1 Tax=Alkalihalophilus marmarensis DSM 21297 TaxID=1188261 RepID=U6SKW3_9BACI|nr:class III lanthionine synthetase LanKC [Alkalihalophilus marmarensis]ERN52022.1 hypothetical protein A33I_18185 [Alkalihalophilus marmarensis DSM 21297]
MDFRYLRYVVPEQKYYLPPNETGKKDELLTLDTPSGWGLERNDHWTTYFCKETKLPLQGWKIHISSTIKHAKETLQIISTFMFEHKIAFKHVSDLRELVMKNSKYGERTGSGKFITIYPTNENQFVTLLDTLNDLIGHLPNGPYILSDKRWKNGNVFFRYGAFAEMYTTVSGEKVLAIQDDTGALIPDTRGTSYAVPPFITEPTEIKEMTLEQDMAYETSYSELSNYDITSALHFSNGGGVYLGTDIRSEKKVVIKEGRPGAGLDGAGRDAVARLKHEAKMLENLQAISSVVNLRTIFQEWEHTFVVQDYIEGTTLNSWLAVNYPFSEEQDAKRFSENAINLLKQIIAAIKDIHSKGIGMGDLQPNNVMVTPENKIILIDFEAASDITDKKHPGLATPGFVGHPDSTREQADWFALLRIARQAFIPIGPVQDLAESILQKHDDFILDVFGKEAYELIKDIESECLLREAKPVPSILSSPSQTLSLENIPEIIEKLRNGIIHDLGNDSRLLPGDIRQYELTGGLYNAYTGGTGVLLALSHTGDVPSIALRWAKEYLNEETLSELDDGLLSGRAGIAGVLYQIGFREKANKIFNEITIDRNSRDITLYSGLAGVGLSLLSASNLTEDKHLYSKSVQAAEKLVELLKEDIQIMKDDWDTITKGLIHGWSGVSLFFSTLYHFNGENKWLEYALLALQKDLDQCEFEEGAQFYQVKDDARYVPYLAGGSGGVGLAMIQYKNVSGSIELWQKELHGIGVAANSKTFFGPGLFRGLTGLISAADAVDRNLKLPSEKGYLERTFSTINLYLLEQEDRYYIPGDYNYRLSGDLFSGAAGVLLALNDINRSMFSWLPLAEYETIGLHKERKSSSSLLINS